MELNRAKKNAAKSILLRKHPEPNPLIQEKPKLNIESTVVEANEKNGMFHSPHNCTISIFFY